MTGLSSLIRRNTKLFFKDKAMFFTALITPMILLVLYMTFLSNVYRDSFLMAIPEGISVDDKIMDGAVAGQLVSSLLAVCCVTVAFCSNMLMVQDKVSGARRDLTIAPVKSSCLALSYYISTAITTLIICFAALGAGLMYVNVKGWYLSGSDVACLWLDTFLMSMFGTALSSVISFFLSSQGQISAVGTVISSCYGFICGAYMPISNFADGLQKVLSFLPGTYGTVLFRTHAMDGAFTAMEEAGLPAQVTDSFRSGVDCRIDFMGHEVTTAVMYTVVGSSVALLIVVYILLNVLKSRKR